MAKVNNAEYVEDDIRQFYKELGVDELIYPEILVAKEINNGLKMSWVRQRWDVHGGALVMLAIKSATTARFSTSRYVCSAAPTTPTTS